MKKYLAVFTALCAIGTATVCYAKDLGIFYNKNKIECPEAFIEEDTTLVPARAVFEKMGEKVDYKDNKVSVVKDDTNITIVIGDKNVFYKKSDDEQKSITAQTAAKIVNDITYIPIRVVSEIMDKNVYWNPEAFTITIADKTFADKLNEYMPDDQNYMFSPLSIQTALAMAANGATGENKDEMLRTLDIEDLDAFNGKVKSLTEQYSKTDIMNLNIANSLWLNTDICGKRDFLQEYKDKIKTYYDDSIQTVTNDNSVKSVNDWVNEKTNGKISSILSEQDKKFAAALVNAVYFKAGWQNELNPLGKRDFTSRDKTVTQTDFMGRSGYMNYAERDGVRIVELPYKSYDSEKAENAPNISMYLMMSEEEFEPVSTLDNAGFTTQKFVRLSMPKFKFDYSINLNDALQKMGMVKAFDNRNKEGFDKMIPSESKFWLYIDKVAHKTYIDVDEKGTEAAAVTAVVMKAAGCVIPHEPIIFTADKPFTFVIKDNTNDTILFVGEYAFVQD